ncbi:MAG: TIGR00341 family protein [Pseudomonadota bacterium]
MKKIDIFVSGTDVLDCVSVILKHLNIVDYAVIPMQQQDRRQISALVRDGEGERLIGALKQAELREGGLRLVVSDITATYPPLDEAGEKTRRAARETVVEEMIDKVSKQSAPTAQYVALMVFSSIIAATGLITDSAAGVIGSMVIAPVLAPMMAVSLGALVFDVKMLGRAAISLGIFVVVAVLIGWGVGLLLNIVTTSAELNERASISLGSLLFAIAAGGAAGVAIQDKSAAPLVGVMVAAALVPAAAAVGVFFAAGLMQEAYGAATLTGLNLLAIVLMSAIIFFVSGIRPEKGGANSQN